jgi:hypothetical protein
MGAPEGKAPSGTRKTGTGAKPPDSRVSSSSEANEYPPIPDRVRREIP